MPPQKAVKRRGGERGKVNPTCFLFLFPPPPPFFIFLLFPGYLGAPATCPEIPLLAQWRFGAREFKEGLEIPPSAFRWVDVGEGGSAAFPAHVSALLRVPLPSPVLPPVPPMPRGRGTQLVLSRPVSLGVAQMFGAHV